MTLRQFARIVGYVLGFKQRRRIRFVRTVAVPPPCRATSKAMQSPARVFEGGGPAPAQSDEVFSQVAKEPEPTPQQFYDATARFKSTPANPLRRSGRR